MNQKVEMPIDYEIGEKVVITDKTLKTMKAQNRSILAHPCDTFIELAESCKGLIGTVTARFHPGFEMNVEFDRPYIRDDGHTQKVTIMQMKDNWVERAEENCRYCGNSFRSKYTDHTTCGLE